VAFTHEVAQALNGLIHRVLLLILLALLPLLALLALLAGHHAHVLQHLHQSSEHLAGFVAIAAARQLFDLLQEILQILLRHGARIGRHLTRLLLLAFAIARKLLH
jgi:hypothetical protein